MNSFGQTDHRLMYVFSLFFFAVRMVKLFERGDGGGADERAIAQLRLSPRRVLCFYAGMDRQTTR